jgi:hypothetical protein
MQCSDGASVEEYVVDDQELMLAFCRGWLDHNLL